MNEKGEVLPSPVSPLGKKKTSLRFAAFCAVTFATVSLLACIIALPLVYNHVHSIQAYMQNEVEFCKVRYPYHPKYDFHSGLHL